ncbi:NmrA family NAD(P)-binding protein [Pseudonocardia sp. S2-4]|uniref:NmrA family NAD(P)-binding protein n=1 Tax=Pseudonocardia humida TaxID=2800819 RepID=A0ABT0ZWI6_9PSEU|nr:NmrA family NAD(P)-binding protein [Pseudonocardia humida]
MSGVEPVLVTGAAGGRQGSTGRHVVDLLLARGLGVRALVRVDDERAAALRALGAEVVVGDLREIADLGPALRGVRRAFLTYPVTHGLVDATGAFAVAAREAGLERVVDVSQLAADPGAGTPHMRQHWVAEQVLDRFEVGAVHLRAGVFFENLAVVAAAAGYRELALPLGPPDTVLPLVAAEDVARVAAGLLVDPDPVEPVYRLTGQVLSVRGVVEAFGAALGHEVDYVDVAPEAWRAAADDLYRDDRAVEHLTALWAMFRMFGSVHELYRVSEEIERIGGRPPRRLADHLRGRQARV